jgi:hypothetical protein
VLGDNDQFTCQRCSLLRRRKALQTFVVGESLEIGGRIYGLSTRTQAVAPVVKAYDLLYPLDANVKRAVAFGEELDIIPASDLPSEPRIGAISASAMPTGFPSR